MSSQIDWNKIKAKIPLLILSIILSGFFYYVRTTLDIEVSLTAMIFTASIGIVFAILCGVIEAPYWYLKSRCDDDDYLKLTNEHFWLMTIRGCFYGVIYIFTGIYFILGLGLMFMFFHDGFYYLMRNKIDSHDYKKGFTDYSTTSTALITLTFKTRSILAMSGLGVVIFGIIQQL